MDIINLTDKWQCCMCKETKVIEVTPIEAVGTGVMTLSTADREKIKCCFRLMRNLSETAYTKENNINVSGLRDSNMHRAIKKS